MTVVNNDTGLSFEFDIDRDRINADALPFVKQTPDPGTIQNVWFIKKHGTLEIVVTLVPLHPPPPGEYVGLVYDNRRPNEESIATLRLTVYT